MKAKDTAQQAHAAQSVAEQALKKLEWESKEREENLTRQIAKLSEEVGFLRAKQAATFEIPDSKEAGVLRSTLATLESRFREVKELYNSQKRELDEASFECETLRTTVDRLKNECQDSSDREAGERKQRHSLEMALIEIKKKFSEISVSQKETEEAFKQSINEIGVLRGELSQQGELLKVEKRKALALDRELEQCKFLAERKDKEHRDNIDLLTIQVKNYKCEIEGMNSRIELMGKEIQLKSSKDNKEASSHIIRIRELETREANLLVSIEDLQKKLIFYKEKATKRDYNSVSKNSILEKLASVIHFVISIKETWETEKFIIKQEMSCMARLLAQTSDIYFHNLKPKQLRRHIEQNITSKIFSRFTTENDGGLATCTFGSATGLYSDRKELIENKGQFFKRLEEELTTLSSKITPKKQLTSEQSGAKKNSPSKIKEDRRPLAEIKNSTFGNSSYFQNEFTPLASDRSTAREAKSEKNEIRGFPSTNQEKSKESTTSFISRINAKVLEKSKNEPSTLISKTPVKITNNFKHDFENKNPNTEQFSEKMEIMKNIKLPIGDDKFDYQKIEKESEEIARRIQALKLKDFSHLKQ